MKTWVNGGELCDKKFQKQGCDAPRAPSSLFTFLRNIYINRKKIGFMSFFFRKIYQGKTFCPALRAGRKTRNSLCPERGQDRAAL